MYLEQDDAELDEIEQKRQDKFDDGYLEGKDWAKRDLKHRQVDIGWLRQNRRINDPYQMGFEVGYLRQLLVTLTEGKIT